MSHDSWTHCAVLLQLPYTLNQDIRAAYLTGMESWKSRLQHESWQSYIRPWSCCFLTLSGSTAPLVAEMVFKSAMPKLGVWCEHRTKLKMIQMEWFYFPGNHRYSGKACFSLDRRLYRGMYFQAQQCFLAMIFALFKLTLKFHFCLRPAWEIFQRKMCPAAPGKPESPFFSLFYGLRCS